MPKFDFQCSDCDKHFEKTVDVGDDKTPKCPHCKSENTKKILSAPGVIFKGKGFYGVWFIRTIPEFLS